MEPFSATHKDTNEHKAAEAAARKAHTEGAGTFFAWLNDHCDPDAARSLRREVPAPVLFLILRVADATTTAASHRPGHEPGPASTLSQRPCRI